MFENEFYISSLIAAHLAEELSPEQEVILNDWLERSSENQRFFDELVNEQAFNQELRSYRKVDKDAIWQKTASRISIEEQKLKKTSIKKLFPFYKIAAAITFLVIGAGLLYYVRNTKPDKNLQAEAKYNNIKPGRNVATLSLPDGKVISLSDAQNGVIVAAGKLIYKDGSILKDSIRRLLPREDEKVNLTTPRGGTYQITLSDGTKVWINSASSLKFPISFSALKERKVELIGEAYFEVAKDQDHPFIVTSKDQNVKVLGTHFNMSSYSDEPETRTTLLEGAVLVKSADGMFTKNILPGQEAISSGKGLSVRTANIEEVMAWKEGYFRFYREDLGSIMRKISRWYNVNVTFVGEEKQYDSFVFDGVIKRSKGIAEVLEIIERTGKVSFSIEKNKVIVSK